MTFAWTLLLLCTYKVYHRLLQNRTPLHRFSLVIYMYITFFLNICYTHITKLFFMCAHVYELVCMSVYVVCMSTYVVGCRY